MLKVYKGVICAGAMIAALAGAFALATGIRDLSRPAGPRGGESRVATYSAPSAARPDATRFRAKKNVFFGAAILVMVAVLFAGYRLRSPLLRWAPFGGAEHAALVELRRAILRRPLGLDFTAEQLADEKDQLHLGAWDVGRAVGVLVLAPRGKGEVQMRQVAVAADAQGRGIGRLLVAESEAEARRRGWTRMILHARDLAVPFYEKLGYAVEGEPYLEIGIPHRSMAKALKL